MLIRLEYEVGEELRYISHLDFLRLFIRAIRRGKLPIAYSQGFSPHPKLSLGPPLAVGLTSSREYLDFELTQDLPLLEVAKSLEKSLPQGVCIKEMVEITGKAPSLMAIIKRATYEINVLQNEENEQLKWTDILNRFLDREEVFITRQTKKGPRQREIRSGIFELEIKKEGEELTFSLQLQNDNHGVVRPEEVIQALVDLEKAPLATQGMRIHRTGLYATQRDKLVTPLEILSS